MSPYRAAMRRSRALYIMNSNSENAATRNRNAHYSASRLSCRPVQKKIAKARRDDMSHSWQFSNLKRRFPGRLLPDSVLRV